MNFATYAVLVALEVAHLAFDAAILAKLIH